MTGPRGLLDIDIFRLPASTLQPAIDRLRGEGAAGNEGFVLLGGTIEPDGRRFSLSSAYWPDQIPQTTDEGLLVKVPGEALHRANLAFHRRGEIMAAQVHTHPTDAYHSELDDHLPLVTLLGALSVVIPDFAADGLDALDRWAFYRLTGAGQWRLASSEVEVVG